LAKSFHHGDWLQMLKIDQLHLDGDFVEQGAYIKSKGATLEVMGFLKEAKMM
jgi:hypothetical protein